MDLLIELIVWIFKALAGEEGKDKRSAPGGSSVPPARGPYDYGDGRQMQNPGGGARPAARSRTLEEILEEVRLKQQSGAASQSKAQAQAPKQLSPQEQAERARKNAARRAAKKAAELTQPTAPAAQPQQRNSERTLVSVLDHRASVSHLDEKEVVRPAEIERKFDALKSREDSRFKPLSEVSPSMERPVAQKALRTAETDRSPREFFKMLRESQPEGRREMAQRAMMFAVVFGPPKARGARGGKGVRVRGNKGTKRPT